MHPARFSQYLIVLTLALALGACGLSSASRNVTPSQAMSTPVTVAPTAIPAVTAEVVSHPAHLLIPAIGVNTPVESVGILPDGDMATPIHNPWEDVGWYDAGPRPGERGSAVIDGHLDRPGGYPAVFWRLRDLHTGDDVWVINSDSTRLHFHVTRIAFYPPQQAPIQDIFGNDGGTYLNLITCAGDWIPSQHQTNLRLVIYTILV